jgi:hypothetical protein
MNKFALIAIIAALFVVSATASEDDGFLQWGDDLNAMDWSEIVSQDVDGKRSLQGGYYEAPAAPVVQPSECAGQAANKTVFCPNLAGTADKCQATLADCNTQYDAKVNQCANNTVAQGQILCSDGTCAASCVTATNPCSGKTDGNTFQCPVDGSCKKSASDCPPATCGNKLRCLDGTCVTAFANCPAARRRRLLAQKALVCTAPTSKKCEDAGTCIRTDMSCPDWTALAGNEVCYNGSFKATTAECTTVKTSAKTANSCAAEICWDNSCVANTNTCTARGAAATALVKVKTPTGGAKSTVSYGTTVGYVTLSAATFNSTTTSKDVTFVFANKPASTIYYTGLTNFDKTTVFSAVRSPVTNMANQGTENVVGELEICNQTYNISSTNAVDPKKYCLAYVKDSKWRCSEVGSANKWGALSVGKNATTYCGKTTSIGSLNAGTTWAVVDSTGIQRSDSAASVFASVTLTLVLAAIAALRG